MPFLAAARDGAALLSWLEPRGGKHFSLRLARWRDGSWGNATDVASGDNWFINWSDFPSITELENGVLLAHWLERVGHGKYGYGIRVARADARRQPWSNTFFAAPSDPEDYSGFLTFIPDAATAGAVYLAPPPASPGAATGGHVEHRKTLRYVEFDDSGRVRNDRELDSDVCSCCQTAIAATKGGLLTAYRDHLAGEVRDISFMRYTNRIWSTPKTLHRDGWSINGCPSDGPSLAARANLAGIAWLTRASGLAKIQVAFSKDSGERFSSPVRVDDGNPLGRPAVAMLDNDLLVTWLEKTASEAEVRLKRVSPGGPAGKPLTIARVAASRTTGFPKVIVTGNRVLIAWCQGRVQAASLDPKIAL